MFKNPRQRVIFLTLLVLAGGIAYVTVRYMHGQGTASRRLYDPGLTILRVGGVPVYKPQASAVEVMAGLPVEVSCELVPPATKEEKASFRVVGHGAPKSADRCAIPVVFDGKPGDHLEVTLEYIVTAADGTARTADTWSAALIVVPRREFLRVRALQTVDGQQLAQLTAPQKVVPYVDAALVLPGKPAEYVVLFFVQPVGVDRPVLQVYVPGDQPDSFRVNVAPVKRFRSWGGGIEGYIAWPGGAEPGSKKKPEPILVGDRGDTRAAFEIFAALFLAEDVEAVAQKALHMDRVEGDQVVVTLRDLTMDEIRDLAYKGWVSPGLRVVRSEHADAQAATWVVR